jgi:hypothetical protein
MDKKRIRDQLLYARDINSKATEKLILFLNYYIDGHEPRDSWVLAGYSESTQNLAMTKLRENWKIVDKMIDERIGLQVPMALAVVANLAKNGKSESIKLQAAKDLLARAGRDRPVEHVFSTKDPEEMKDDDVDKEIRALIKDIGLEAS